MIDDENRPSRMIPIPAGSLLTITTGVFSTYQIEGVFLALQEIDAEALREQWLVENPDQREDYNFSESKFLAWVTKLGCLEPVDCFEWHLFDWGCASEMKVTKLDDAGDEG